MATPMKGYRNFVGSASYGTGAKGLPQSGHQDAIISNQALVNGFGLSALLWFGIYVALFA